MQPYEVIQSLEATPSKLEKEAIVREAFLAGCGDFFVGARMAYDPLITFGQKKIPKIDDEDDSPSTVSMQDFLALAERLRLRQLTGHAARDAINDFLNRCSIVEWNDFYRRVLLKDLKVGVTEGTINKALKALVKEGHATAAESIIPVFAVQLAPSESYNRSTIGKLRGRVLADIKYDGMRLSTVLDKEAGTVTQYSRTGLVNENFPHVREALTKLMDRLPKSVMIDGEMVGGSFNAFMRLASKEGADTSSTMLMIFDIVPLEDFRKGLCEKTQEERHALLVALKESGLIDEVGGGSLYILPKVDLDLDTEQGQAALNEMFEEVMRLRETDKKFEGLIVKKPDAPYKCKRWNGWEKVKPYVDASLAVVGLEEGKADTKNAGSLGALICRGRDGDREIEVRVGSGYTDAERRLWWSNPDLVMGMIAEIEAHEFSQDEKNEGTDMWSMRHPRLKGWRGTKPGEKL